jgi:hypothetical protein
MDNAATDEAAFDETVVFLSHFQNLADHRQPGKISYPLNEIVLLCLLAVLADAECFTERLTRNGIETVFRVLSTP